jgi:hypothetical protein
MAATATTATTIPTATTRWSSTSTGIGGGENGKFFGQLGRTTMRAGCTFPMAGADENLTITLTLLAMEFINRHENRIIVVTKSSRQDSDFAFSFNGQRLTFAYDSLATGD